jgi:hypothetical protein
MLFFPTTAVIFSDSLWSEIVSYFTRDVKAHIFQVWLRKPLHSLPQVLICSNWDVGTMMMRDDEICDGMIEGVELTTDFRWKLPSQLPRSVPEDWLSCLACGLRWVVCLRGWLTSSTMYTNLKCRDINVLKCHTLSIFTCHNPAKNVPF